MEWKWKMLAAKTNIEKPEHSMTFEDIYREYGDKILNLAYRMTGKEEVARDLTQDVFVKVYEKIAFFRGDAQIYTWIYRVATNHILNYLKKQQRRQWLNLLDKSIEEVITENNVTASFWGQSGPMAPDHKLEKKEREQIFRKILEGLSVKYRVPFILHRYEGMSYQEIATIMGLSLSAVEARIHRAKKMVIKKLSPIAEAL